MDRLMPADAPVGFCRYVSPSGNDSNAGTLAAPWLTLAHAQTAVAALITGMAGPITVVLRAGTYYLTSMLAFTSADSGTNGYTVTWQSFPGELVTISGGITISTWTLHDAGKQIWQATVSAGVDFRQLYVGDTRVTRARQAETLSGSGTNSSGFTSTGGAYSTYAIPTDLEFIFPNWFRETRCPVTAVSGTTISMATPAWTNILAAGGTTPWVPSFVEGAYEILAAQHAAQTFYLNKTTNTLYYRPADSVDPNTLTVIGARVTTLISCTGTSHLAFMGLNFAHTGWFGAHSTDGFLDTGGAFYATGASSWGLVPPAALHISGGSATIRSCAVLHGGGSGILVDAASNGAIIDGCIVADISALGIAVSTPDEYTLNPTTRNTLVANTIVHDTGVEYRGGLGIYVGYGRSVSILHNRVYNTPYIGIRCGHGGGNPATLPNQGGYNLLAWNDVGPAMTGPLYDGGGFYLMAVQPGTVVQYNVSHDITHNAINTSAGYFLDDGSEYYTLAHNYLYTCADNAIHLHNTIGNNVISTTTGDNTAILNEPGALNGQGGASTDSVASIGSATTAAVQAWAASAGAGLQPQFAALTALA